MKATTSVRPEDLADRVARVEARMDELAQRVDQLQAGATPPMPSQTASPTPVAATRSSSWSSNLETLPLRIAAACFILVFALVLRTITDNELVPPGWGTLLGLAYAVILTAVGWYFHVRGSRLTPVFSLFGLLLLFLIVIEGHGRFQTLSPTMAVILLFIALISSSTLGIRYRVPSLLTVCSLGTALAGLAPESFRLPFAPTALLFLLAESRVDRAADRGVVRKLAWVMTLLTLVFWFRWTVDRQGAPAGFTAEAWGFGLLLLCFGTVYFTTYLRGFGNSNLSRSYTAALPVLTALLLYFAGKDLLVRSLGVSPRGFGLMALGLAMAYACIAGMQSRRYPERTKGVTGAWVAALFLLVMALPPVTGSVAWAIPVWAAASYLLLRLPFPGCAACMRGLTYIFQCVILAIGLAWGALLTTGGPSMPAALTAALALAVFSLASHAWCRNHPLPVGEDDGFPLHPADLPVVLSLLVGLTALYGLGWSLIGLGTEQLVDNPHDLTQGLRSVFLCLLAMPLLVMGGMRRNRELAGVAIAVGVLAGVNVFVVDMIQIRGLPLILGVLTFGLLAATGSVVMGKWRKGEDAPPP